ncbi:MAG: hypothetical protein QXW79_00705 [Thermoplasmata archaeon]
MDYKQILCNELLSKKNIDYLVGMILQNFKISKKAIPKCINIITTNLSKYLHHIDRFPENIDEVIQALCFLNKKCFEDFANYLSNKYPNVNLLREKKSPHLIGTNEPAKIIILNGTTEPPKNPLYSQNIASLLSNVLIPSENTALFDNTMHPKNIASALFEDAMHPKNTAMLPNSANYELLAFLANPLFLQLYNLFNNSIHTLQNNNLENFSSQNSGRINQPDIIFDEILEPSQVQELIKKIIEDRVNSSKSREPENRGKNKRTSEKISLISDDLILKSEDIMDDNDEIVESALRETESNNDEKSEDDEIGKFDLTKNVSKETLPMIEKRVSEIISLRNKYLEENNREMVDKIDKERDKIIEAVRIYKEKLEAEMRKNEGNMKYISKLQNDDNLSLKLESFRSEKVKPESTKEDHIEILDLMFDPNECNDLKNIVIKVRSEKKIVDITLVSYYLPFNPNNVTKFNNKFSIYFNDRINQIVLQPGKYNIQTLIDYIRGQINFLDFSTNENNIITIKNKMETKFDLMVGDDTIFPLLGFVDKIDNYKDKLFYSASQPYNMECNEKIYFSLAGSTMEPLLLEFDKNVTLNKTIKKSNAGVRMKQLILKFTNSLGQYYEFVAPFKICFRITYAK